MAREGERTQSTKFFFQKSDCLVNLHHSLHSKLFFVRTLNYTHALQSETITYCHATWFGSPLDAVPTLARLTGRKTPKQETHGHLREAKSRST